MEHERIDKKVVCSFWRRYRHKSNVTAPEMTRNTGRLINHRRFYGFRELIGHRHVTIKALYRWALVIRKHGASLATHQGEL